MRQNAQQQKANGSRNRKSHTKDRLHQSPSRRSEIKVLSEQTTELGCGRPSGQNIKPGLKPQNNNKNGKRNRKILKSWWWILKNTLNIIPKKVPVSLFLSL